MFQYTVHVQYMYWGTDELKHLNLQNFTEVVIADIPKIPLTVLYSPSLSPSPHRVRRWTWSSSLRTRPPLVWLYVRLPLAVTQSGMLSLARQLK